MMTFDVGLLVGLISIAIGLISIAIALFFGLREFARELRDHLSAIKDKVTAMHQTLDKVWDLISNSVPLLLAQRGGTVERNLKNLGRTKIEARLGPESTDYVIDVEKPVLSDGLIAKLSKDPRLGYLEKEQQLFGREALVHALSPSRIILHVPCTDSKICTEFMTFFLKWLDSTYFESLGQIRDFEEPILKE